MKLLVLLLLAFIVLVNGHAVLVKPTPFSKNPSTAQPCGAGTPQTTNTLGKICRGKTNTFVWDVVVGDGTGKVTFKLSTKNDKNNFDVTLGTSVENPDKVGTFSLHVDIPKDAPEGNFLIQASSSTKWNSCSFVQVTDDCTEDENPTTEVLAFGTGDAKFCQMKLGKSVVVPVGTVLTEADDDTKAVFSRNMNNINVIGTNTSECGSLYKPILCDTTFPLAPGSDGKPVYQVSYDDCTSFIKTCDVSSHIDLYPCGIYKAGLENSSSKLTISAFFAILIFSIVLLL
ncbi:hypothetical protein DICPUDRAFT_95627 [Dictyostelium purpureum]|uniref:Uncharacterized protein n=1 Tax=Dictyostelium purpureum TaxID=5786 RepID=F0ZYJ4_DICPU|nr:uncharacterized protein DICPUDRAFT_95627 [Dictyostelium purpureum]EGC30989.1 hypothetical protein DICPUDRAFT_95627 [Dictyostelium purpureum]|eukprot:XP_003292490.1 hypothetical protein DICPUDRAFT_95627 [Dictyostelium purpureum]